MDNILQMNKVCKTYGRTQVVGDMDFTTQKGHICGLIGPNGAGKTTIMKMIAGLTRADSGEISLFGDSTALDENRKRCSFMIESPIVDLTMTARENLEYVRFVRGVADKKRIDDVLEFSGLGNTGRKKVKQFSLGMKQRLGIALALLSKPEIMVLDEPVNGLDPEGIVDVRLMLKKLAEEDNVSIIISSHLLSELSELCTDFTIINHGRLVESFSAEELQTKCRNHISLKTTDINATAAVLENKLNVREYKVIHGDEIHIFEQLDNIAKISKTIADSNIIITRLCEDGESLEEYYLSKVGGING